MSGEGLRYPPIGDYGLIGDCHSVALVSRAGSIDWCCMPRLDSGSTFGRLLDWDAGGYCLIAPTDTEGEVTRSYLDGTMVLETIFRTSSGEARLLDCFTMHSGGASNPDRQLLRIVEGARGRVELTLAIVARFDYGGVKPWVRMHRPHLWSAMGGDDAILISSEADLELRGRHDLHASYALRGRRTPPPRHHLIPTRTT